MQNYVKVKIKSSKLNYRILRIKQDISSFEILIYQ